MSLKNKYNIVKQDPFYHTATNTPTIVELGQYDYIKIKGRGETLSTEFNNKVNGIFFFYKMLQQTCKKQDINLTFPKLEVIRWVQGDNILQNQVADEDSFWILLVRKYDFISDDLIEETKDFCIRKKNFELADEIFTERIHIGKCIQIMHYGKIGSEIYSRKEIKKFISLNGLQENGFYQEVHLSYPRKVIPENMKSILRQPVE